jgi:hypothetical protein
VRVDYFRSSKSFDGENDLLGFTTQVKLLPTFNDSLEGKFEARLYSPDIRDGQVAGTLLEGFLTFRFARAELRLGKQIVAWGRADGINPTDNLTPRDYSVMCSRRGGYRALNSPLGSIGSARASTGL